VGGPSKQDGKGGCDVSVHSLYTGEKQAIRGGMGDRKKWGETRAQRWGKDQRASSLNSIEEAKFTGMNRNSVEIGDIRGRTKREAGKLTKSQREKTPERREKRQSGSSPSRRLVQTKTEKKKRKGK